MYFQLKSSSKSIPKRNRSKSIDFKISIDIIKTDVIALIKNNLAEDFFIIKTYFKIP
jgi:hypothetical protein